MQTKAHTFLALTAAALALPFSSIQGQSFSQAEQQAKADLDQAIQELSSTRTSIAKEKIPLIREVSKLEDQVRQQDAELKRLRRLRDNTESGLLRLKERVDGIKAQNEYAAGLLDEFVRSFETRIDYAEQQLYLDATKEAKLALEDSDMTQADRFSKQVDVIGAALDRLEKLVGGYRFEGLALAPNGDIVEGNFATFGPNVYFASTQSNLAGLAVTKLNAAEAAIVVPGVEFTAGIRQLVETGEGELPADITLGKALKIEQSSIGLGERIQQGGTVGYVILSLGGVCLILGIIKIGEIVSFKTAAPETLQKVLTSLEAGKQDEAEQIAADMPGAGGDLIRKGVACASEKRGTLEEILYEKILAVRPKLERFLPFMALTAAAAPLLGLLGTVTGMIKTFQLITIFGTGDAKSLSSGISEALVTTALGLVVAIPALILHGVLSRMARQKIGDMEQSAVGFINGVVGAKNKDQ